MCFWVQLKQNLAITVTERWRFEVGPRLWCLTGRHTSLEMYSACNTINRQNPPSIHIQISKMNVTAELRREYRVCRNYRQLSAQCKSPLWSVRKQHSITVTCDMWHKNTQILSAQRCWLGVTDAEHVLSARQKQTSYFAVLQGLSALKLMTVIFWAAEDFNRMTHLLQLDSHLSIQDQTEWWLSDTYLALLFGLGWKEFY